MKKQELLKYIGDISQIGGVRDFTFNDGRKKGVRAVEVRTGNLCFTVLPDRCLDIAQVSFKGQSVSWISKAGIAHPAYYEKDGTNFLRGFFGGLVTTCGLRNIGRPYGDNGLHGRIANIPAENISVSTDWVDDEYVMKISGQMRESAVFGENLLVKRTITAKLFSDEISLRDTVVNEGFRDENIAFCYHCNFGYPLVRENARILNVPEELNPLTGPQHGIEEECIGVEQKGEYVTVGIDNGETRALLTYRSAELPDFLVWKMLGESEYTIGLEPRTTNYGGPNIDKNGKYVILKPFESFDTDLKFKFQSV